MFLKNLSKNRVFVCCGFIVLVSYGSLSAALSDGEQDLNSFFFSPEIRSV